MDKKNAKKRTDTHVVHDNNVEIRKLPNTFIASNTWPKSTGIRCWHCDLTFDERPIFVPKSSENSISGVVMVREGCFCSFNCAMAYINTYYPRACDNINRKKLLSVLFKRMYGKMPNEVIPAPSKFTMVQYGGIVSAQDYKTKINELQKISGVDVDDKKK